MRPPFPRNDPGKAPGRALPAAPPWPPEPPLVVFPHRLRGPLDPSGAFGKLRDGPELVDPAVQGIVKLPYGPALAQVGGVVLVPAALNGGGGEPRLLARADDRRARGGGGR